MSDGNVWHALSSRWRVSHRAGTLASSSFSNALRAGGNMAADILETAKLACSVRPSSLAVFFVMSTVQQQPIVGQGSLAAHTSFGSDWGGQQGFQTLALARIHPSCAAPVNANSQQTQYG